MATSTIDELYQTFQAVSGQQTSAIGGVNAILADVIAQVRDVRNSVPAPASKTQTTTDAGATGGGITAGSVASTVLESGFGLVPLITGLVSLFSGGAATTPAPLVKYALPASIDFQAAESRTGVSAMGYDQMGMPRSYADAATGGGGNAAFGEQVTGLGYNQLGASQSYAQAASSGGATAPGMGAAPQITVNVQAMDARSFLDRSSDIALAVRDAMLNLNAINDVVNEL